MTPSSFNPDTYYKQWSASLSPGLSTGNPFLDTGLSFMLGSGVFPQMQGTGSAADMMLLRQRNLDQHTIMRRGFAANQLARRMGGIDPDGAFYRQFYPMLASPDGPLLRMMSPLIGGNPVRAQMGLYADLNGMSMGAFGQLGAVTASQTDRMMEGLNSQFYRPANFGRYAQSTAPRLQQLLGPAGYAALSQNWTAETVAGLAGQGVTGVNRPLTGLLEDRLGKLAAARQGGTDAAGLAAMRQEALDASRSFIDGITDQAARAKISQSFAKALDSQDVKQGVRDFVREWDPVKDEAHRMVVRGLDMRLGKVPGGIDFNQTRGFLLEDVTGAFGMAARTGLLGRNTGRDLGQFLGPGARVLDAARGIFGRDLSGRELTAELGQLIGTGHTNLADESEARSMEQLLRNVKAAARIAGISIESMRGIIDEGKLLAARNPNLLMGVSGIDASRSAISAVGRASAYLTVADPRQTRLMGGTVGMVSDQMALDVESRGQPISQQLGALASYFNQARGPGSAALQQIRTYAQRGDTTVMGFNRFVTGLAQSNGVGVEELFTFAGNNKMASHAGLELMPELAGAGRRAMLANIQQRMDRQLPGMSAGLSDALFEVALNPESYAGMSDAQIMGTLGRRVPGIGAHNRTAVMARIAPVLGTMRRKHARGEGLMTGGDILSGLRIADLDGSMAASMSLLNLDTTAQYSRTFQQSQAAFQGMQRESAALDTFMAENLGVLNSPIVTRVVQSLIEGNLQTGGLEELRSILSGGPLAGVVTGAQQQLEQFNRLRSLGPLDEAGQGRVLDQAFRGMDRAGLRQLTAGGRAGEFHALRGEKDAGVRLSRARRLAAQAGMSELSADRLMAAMATFDPTGSYRGDFSTGSLYDFAQVNLASLASLEVNGLRGQEALTALQALEGMGAKDSTINSASLDAQLQVLMGDKGSMAALRPFVGKVTPAAMRRLADLQKEGKTEDALSQATFELGRLKMDPGGALSLLQASKTLVGLDGSNLLTGTEVLTDRMLWNAGLRSGGLRLQEAMLQPLLQTAGAKQWAAMTDPRSNTNAGWLSSLEAVRTEVMDGRAGNLQLLRQKMEDPKVRARVEQLMQNAGPGAMLRLDSAMEQIGGIEADMKKASGLPGKSMDTLLSEGITKIVGAITTLTNVLQTATKGTP